MDDTGVEKVPLRQDYGQEDGSCMWSNKMLEIRQQMSPRCIRYGGHADGQNYIPFVVDKSIVGVVTGKVVAALRSYPEAFSVDDASGVVTFAPNVNGFDGRTTAMESTMRRLKELNLFSSLDGWRNENFSISGAFNECPLFEMERTACALFGMRQYGVHVNGYVVGKNGNLSMWIGRRSNNKQTWPGCLDNMVGGGVSAGETVMQTLIKECSEEASLHAPLVDKAKPTGNISYWHENQLGLGYEVEFVYDLEVADDFVPRNADGEVSSFQLMSMSEVKSAIFEERFKPNCALVILDFMIRHSLLTPDDDPNYTRFLTLLHQSFDAMIARS